MHVSFLLRPSLEVGDAVDGAPGGLGDRLLRQEAGGDQYTRPSAPLPQLAPQIPFAFAVLLQLAPQIPFAFALLLMIPTRSHRQP